MLKCMHRVTLVTLAVAAAALAQFPAGEAFPIHVAGRTTAAAIKPATPNLQPRPDGLHERKSGRWTRVDCPWDLRGNATSAFDHAGRLWVASPLGLGRRNTDGRWSLWTKADGLPASDFTAMAIAKDDTVWLGTSHGVIHFDGD